MYSRQRNCEKVTFSCFAPATFLQIKCTSAFGQESCYFVLLSLSFGKEIFPISFGGEIFSRHFVLRLHNQRHEKLWEKSCEYQGKDLFIIRALSSPREMYFFKLFKSYQIQNFSRSGARPAPEFPPGPGEEILAQLHRHHPYTEEGLLTW